MPRWRRRKRKGCARRRRGAVSGHPSAAGGQVIPPHHTVNTTEVLALVAKAKDAVADVQVVLDKISKAASLALTRTIISETQNQQLIDAAQIKAQRKDREAGDYGKGRVMGPEVLKEHLEFSFNKAW